MIYLVRGTQNTVVLTLREKSTEGGSEYILKFVNDHTGETKVIAVTDDSDHTQRYNLFRITETSDEDFANARVELFSGQWTYTAYEMAASSPRNLDTDDALAVVESGIAEVYDGSEGQVNNFSEGDEKNTPQFDED